MATVSEWTPFGVALDITATGGTVTRTSATQYTVRINASWKTHWNTDTNYGMTASSGGGSVNLNSFGTYADSGSGSFTGTYSISGNGSATKAVTVTFRNFNNDNGDSKTTTVSFNVTVPAWCTLTYNANGGSGAPSKQSEAQNGNITINSTKPTRTGYTFLGWATSSTATSSSYSGGASYKLTKDTTFYAVWTEHALTVNYYSNYATESFADALNAVGSSKNVLVRTAKFYYDNEIPNGHWDYSYSGASTYLGRTGYAGTGYWGTSTSGGTLISQADSYSSGQAMAKAVGKSLETGDASIDLYPQWKLNAYTFNYNANGGLGSMNPQTVEWQEAFTLPNNVFSREGYKFVGWNAYRNNDDSWYVIGQGWLTEDEILTSGYSKKLYENQAELLFDTSWIRQDEEARQFTLYAVWEISGVVYIDNGSTFEPYLAYIDNGTSWDLYLAYVDDGTEWTIIS